MLPGEEKGQEKQKEGEATNPELNNNKAEGQKTNQENDDKADRIEKIRRARRRRLD